MITETFSAFAVNFCLQRWVTISNSVIKCQTNATKVIPMA
uniref:Uncharacterized protein n=1 Tax=Rhizophora mucronata TaxID=61149 RepID=A0A2P2NUJ6_RHIMU